MFPAGVTVTTEVGAYAERRASAFVSRTAPGGFWSGLKAEYDGGKRLTFFLNFENLLNRSDEVWSGYRVEPFRADVGVSFRW
jgi:outer membrane receptor protein involved in Fe transport